MSIERKRNILRISREKVRNIKIQNLQRSNYQLEEETFTYNIVEKNQILLNRIKTTIKSSNLGNKLNPDYIGKLKGETFIIAGCGSSLNYYSDFSKYYVIGVNDIERILTPDFLVVVNDSRTFMRGRWEYVRDSLSPVIFSHLDNPGPITRSSNLVKINLGERNNPNLDRMDRVDYTTNSPYMAAIIAYQLGAKKIGMIGVDFTQDHFFSKTGTHKLSKNLKNIDSEYLTLRNEFEKRGVSVANLSPISLLSSWPKMNLQEFDLL
jgi:uncharacterized Rossmann fold enzyme